jgi:hypothetical protein
MRNVYMDNIEFVNDPEFTKLQEYGFTSDYVMIKGTNPRIISPICTLESALNMGFFPKGTKVKWVDHNGYPLERDRARALFSLDRVLTVKSCNIGRSSSSYWFEEDSGSWNTVMFERVE